MPRINLVAERIGRAPNGIRRSVMRVLRETPAGTWVSPHNPTIRGDANIFGELIPGRIFGGGAGYLDRPIDTLHPDEAIDTAKHKFAGILKNRLKIDPLQMHAAFFRERMPGAFWLWVSSHGLCGAISQESKSALERYPISAFLKVWDAQTRGQGSPDGEDKMREFIIEKDNTRGSLMVVNKDYTGSMKDVFRTLRDMGVEIRFMRNFALPADKGNSIPAYAVSFVYPVETKTYGEQKLSEGEKKALEDLRDNVAEKLTGLVTGSGDEIRTTVANYFDRTIPEAVSGRSPEEIARRIQWFIKMGRDERVTCKVQYDDSRTVGSDDPSEPRLMVYLNTRFTTSSIAAICDKITECKFDIRQMSIESQADSGARESRTLCSFVLKRVQKGNERTLESGSITAADGSLLQQKIEEIFNPTLGTENLKSILGPVMVGSSSSHTAGAARIGRYARRFIEAAVKLGWLKKVTKYSLEVRMRNTFALDSTGGGHYSADAVIAGLMEDMKEQNGVTERNLSRMRGAMKLASDRGKKIDIEGVTFSLEPQAAAIEQLKLPQFAAHNRSGLNIVSETKPDDYENQISIWVRTEDGGRPFSVTINSVGGSIIELARIGYNSKPNGTEKPPRKNVLLYSKRSHFTLSGDKPCYLLALKPDTKSPEAESPDTKVASEFKGELFIKRLKEMGVSAREELLGFAVAGRAVFFATNTRIPKEKLDVIAKEFGCIEEVEYISDPPIESIMMPFSDFKTLQRVIRDGLPIGQRKCRSLSEVAVAYQEAVFGIPEKQTRKYYRDVLRVMFMSVRDGLFSTESLPNAFACSWPCVRGPEDVPLDNPLTRLSFTGSDGTKYEAVREGLLKNGYIDENGVVQRKFTGRKEDFKLPKIKGQNTGAQTQTFRALQCARDEMSFAGQQMRDRFTVFPLRSRKELFDLLNARFSLDKPEPGRTFASDRGAYLPEPPQNLSPETRLKIEKYGRIFADPIFHGLLGADNQTAIFRGLETREIRNGNHPRIRSLYDQMSEAWEKDPLVNNVYSLAQAYAVAVNESSAKRGLMVAAPTAGSCGVIPGVLRALKEAYDLGGNKRFTDKELVDALMASSVVGLLFNNKLKTSGGTGGCQAEMGAAIAMAAAAATQMLGGTLDQQLHAIAFGLKQVEGLVCTPASGYVIVPCIKRNGLSAQIALGAAAMAIAGVKSYIDPDCVMDALKEVAEHMDSRYRETGKGGCADSPCGRAMDKRVKKGGA